MLLRRTCKSAVRSRVFTILLPSIVVILLSFLYFSFFAYDTLGEKTFLNSFNARELRLTSALFSGKRNAIAVHAKTNISQFDSRMDTPYSKTENHPVLDPKSRKYNKDKFTNSPHAISAMELPMKNFRELMKMNYETFSSDIGEDNVENGDKYFIYRCDGKWMSHCGGWADRLKGILAGYVIANLTGRTFKAETRTSGCNILDYIVPNHVNWSLPRPFHEQVYKSHPDVQILNGFQNMGFYRALKKTNFSPLPVIGSKFIYFKSNSDYIDGFKANKFYAHQLSWMRNLTRDQIAGNLFRRLFKPSPSLRKKLEDFLQHSLSDPSEKLVCAHIRMGANPTIPNDAAVRTHPKDLHKVWKFIETISSKYNRTKVFVMSDSENTIEAARKHSFIRPRLVLVPGDILHIERSKGRSNEEVCEAQTKVVLEQFVLMHCDVLMISKSGLSRIAAYVRGSDVGLFCLVKGSVIPCKMAAIKDIYKILG